ncbi:MAG TPA: hypothetical protein VF038_05455 [Usitatibacter sp.]|jgi:hypothetical protein
MNPTSAAMTLAAVAFFAAAGYGLQAAVSSPPTLMSPADYDRALAGIDKNTRTELGRCRALAQSSRDLCRARARAEERIAHADLDARYYGTVQAEARAQDVRARVRFQLARAECDARGDERAGCLSQARNEQARALAQLAAAS